MRRFATLVTVLCTLALATTAHADVREIGLPTEAPFPNAGCPANCSAVGRVSGYQVQLGRTKNPFSVSHASKLVAFTIRLGKPDASQLQYFSNTFGGQPQARLSVLKPLPRGRGMSLVAQSEIFNLAPYLGSTPTFALSSALSVPAGGIVALTVPTWAPAFAVGLASDQVWRSPRTTCTNNTQYATQQGIGSARQYRCTYKTARLLYSATVVPDPTPTTTPPKKPPTRHTTTRRPPSRRRTTTRRRSTRRNTVKRHRRASTGP